MPYGGEGTPLYTHLERLSQPMTRMLSNDLWVPACANGPIRSCPGDLWAHRRHARRPRRERLPQRPSTKVLNRIPHYGGEHRVVVARDRAMDELTVRMEYDTVLAALGDGAVDGVRGRAESEPRIVLGVATRVEMLPPGSLERTGGRLGHADADGLRLRRPHEPRRDGARGRGRRREALFGAS